MPDAAVLRVPFVAQLSDPRSVGIDVEHPFFDRALVLPHGLEVEKEQNGQHPHLHLERHALGCIIEGTALSWRDGSVKVRLLDLRWRAGVELFYSICCCWGVSWLRDSVCMNARRLEAMLASVRLKAGRPASARENGQHSISINDAHEPRSGVLI